MRCCAARRCVDGEVKRVYLIVRGVAVGELLLEGPEGPGRSRWCGESGGGRSKRLCNCLTRRSGRRAIIEAPSRPRGLIAICERSESVMGPMEPWKA
jgi:hypothetical protein